MQRRTGIRRTGLVWYADHLQVLVKWDDDATSSLRVGHDEFEIVGEESPAPEQRSEQTVGEDLSEALSRDLRRE